MLLPVSVFLLVVFPFGFLIAESFLDFKKKQHILKSKEAFKLLLSILVKTFFHQKDPVYMLQRYAFSISSSCRYQKDLDDCLTGKKVKFAKRFIKKCFQVQKTLFFIFFWPLLFLFILGLVVNHSTYATGFAFCSALLAFSLFFVCSLCTIFIFLLLPLLVAKKSSKLKRTVSKAKKVTRNNFSTLLTSLLDDYVLKQIIFMHIHSDFPAVDLEELLRLLEAYDGFIADGVLMYNLILADS